MAQERPFAGLSVDELEALLIVARKRVWTLERLIAENRTRSAACERSTRQSPTTPAGTGTHDPSDYEHGDARHTNRLAGTWDALLDYAP